MKGFCPLGSGSKGNSIYVGTDDTKILIDAGLSGRAIKQRLAEINVDLADIDAILITHEHSDHIQGLPVLALKLGIPVFANADTAKGIANCLNDCPRFKIFTTGDTFEFGDFEIHPFSIQHDTLDPVAFTIRTGSLKLGFCADLGFVSTLVKRQLQECDYLYIEANHDPDMVRNSPRPMVYKQRVLSRSGHLSNSECGQLLQEISHSSLKHVHLAHLSQECNTHDKALDTVKEHIKSAGYAIDVSIAFQDRVSNAILF